MELLTAGLICIIVFLLGLITYLYYGGKVDKKQVKNLLDGIYESKAFKDIEDKTWNVVRKELRKKLGEDNQLYTIFEEWFDEDDEEEDEEEEDKEDEKEDKEEDDDKE